MFPARALRPLPFRLYWSFPPRASLLMGAFALTILLMPVSYRAGTNQAHVHAIFQPLLDGLLDDHHHHPEDGDAPVAPSPFSSPLVPLSASSHSHSSSTATDVPHQVEMAGAGLATAPILGLGGLIATLLAGSVTRSLWSAAFQLLAVTHGPEPPPPRLGD